MREFRFILSSYSILMMLVNGKYLGSIAASLKCFDKNIQRLNFDCPFCSNVSISVVCVFVIKLLANAF